MRLYKYFKRGVHRLLRANTALPFVAAGRRSTGG
jgi:hypothetical protein